MSIETVRKALDTSVFESLRHRRRRLALAELHSHVYEVSTTDLATGMVARRDDIPLVDVPREAQQSVHVSLCHSHVPMLAATGLVEYDAEESTVRAVDHPAVRDPGIQRVLDAAPSSGENGLDAVFGALADDRRRLVLAVLDEACQPLSREKLALRVEARNRGQPPVDVPSAAVETTTRSLVHTQLPALETAGLVSVDGSDISYEGHPLLRRQWLGVDVTA